MKLVDRIRRECKRILRRLSRDTEPEQTAPVEDAGNEPDIYDGEQSPSVPAPTPEPEQTAPATEPAPRIRWVCGGFDGSRAVEDAAVKIGSVRISDDRISYRWDAAPRDWKRAQTDKGNLVLACAFIWDDSRGAWVGGKFDWTDESRNSRSTENILHGYNGWDAAAWKRAKTRGFCIASADGKMRSAIVKG